jgi:hypothetical protein
MPKSYHDYRPEDEVSEDEDEDTDQREADLSRVGPDPNRKPSSMKLTEDQKRVRSDWSSVRTHEDVAEERDSLDGWYGHDGYGVSTADPDDGDWLHREERNKDRDKTGRWLTRNDPEYKRNRVEARIRRDAAKFGLTLESMRPAFSGGRPTESRSALRRQVRNSLFGAWEDENRTTIADLLNVTKAPLYALMKED